MRPNYNTGLDQHDVINLLIKSQLQRTRHLTTMSPTRYVTPTKDYQTNITRPTHLSSPFKGTSTTIQSSTMTYSKSPAQRQPEFKYAQPNVRRSPNYFKNKYQGFESKYETIPSILMQLLQPTQPLLPADITDHLRNSTIKEFQDFLSQQIYKHILLNNKQYKTESKNHYISNILHQHKLSDEERKDETLKKSVCVMLNHYLQFLITIIDYLSNQIANSRDGGSQKHKEPEHSESAMSFKAAKPVNQIAKTEPDEYNYRNEIQQLQAKAQSHAQQVGAPSNDNPLKFKSFGLQKVAHEINKKNDPDFKDDELKTTPRLVPYKDEKPKEVQSVDQSAKAFANEFLAILFEQGNQRADRMIKTSKQNSENLILNITLSNQSRIKAQSNHSFGTDLQNEGFMILDDPQFDPKLKDRINIPSDDDDF